MRIEEQGIQNPSLMASSFYSLSVYWKGNICGAAVDCGIYAALLKKFSVDL